MNNEDILLALKKNKRKRAYFSQNKQSKGISKFFSKLLLSIIFILSSVIYINTNNKNLLLYKEYVFAKNISFNKINKLYEKYFGKSLPIDAKLTKQSSLVFNDSHTYKDIQDYLDGEKLIYDQKTSINTLESGIVVFNGEKDKYGKTIIIQGIDGVDIWYSNLNNVDVTLYDYVEKDSIIGEVDDYLTMTIVKDGKYLSYEEYKTSIQD